MGTEGSVKASLFSPRATLGFALCLVLPEIPRALSGSLEPYPAVLLPAGAGKVRLPGGRATMKHVLVEAERDGGWYEVDRAELLAPLPVHYFGEVVRGKFGFHDRKWHGLTAPPPAASPAQLRETKTWLRQRLSRMGFGEHRLRVVEQSYVLEVPSGKRHSVERKKVTVYELD
ncbi:MAG TPA: hypothetical protein VJN18_31010 [Polyangiaceae bacterium]|nr:hypothetical protein [Polyangiaceae bacterium]